MRVSASQYRGMSRGELAAHWFVRRDAGELSAGEEASFQAWLAEPGNREAWDDARRAWGAFDGAQDDTHVQALRRAALATRREPRLYRPLVAAALLLVVAGGVLSLLWHRGLPTPALQIAATPVPVTDLAHTGAPDFATATGERREVMLPDGTSVTLNTDTALDVVYTEGERLVMLRKGQAFFEVARNPQRPFVVQTPYRRVVALGTAFDVEVNSGLFQVMLVEGSVRVDNPPESGVSADAAPEVVLAPGQALVARLGVAEQVVELDVERELRWRKGFVEFDNEPLGAAIAELNRYYPEPIVVRDARVAQLRLSGIFRTTPREEFLSIVAEVLPVRVNHAAGEMVELTWAGTP